jgi:NAD(P)-dependent dehydrogenase (short-subunit alcohol dehydrogenase family)
MYYDLSMRGSKIKVSVLCPGWVRTRVIDSERNRPPELMNDPASVPGCAAVVDRLQSCVSRIIPGDWGKVGSGWLARPLLIRAARLGREAGFTSSSDTVARVKCD